MTRPVVLFDLGGVITTSPFERFAEYESRVGLPPDSIRTINATNPDTNAWAKLERNEVTADEFVNIFNAEGLALGLEVDGREVLDCLSGSIRSQMVEALDRLVGAGVRIGAITNNASVGEGASMARNSSGASQMREVLDRFEVVVESSKVGVRKPSPEIYTMACEMMRVEATDAVYLDDLGINCKAAHQLGMIAIKVIDPDEALTELSTHVGVDLI
ncbi:MAG: HAD-IA family hydrolase [Actinomycetia bacterium]|nr:HAD-IA family hydrolase [Actinomycetes bacterium]MCP4960569.1 HAD-IA family hydrolase [Actinomycetes bacterium]